VTHFLIHLISEPVSAYEFDDPRSMRELCDAVARDGYCTFEGSSNRLGNANRGITRQAVFIAYLDDFKLMMLVTFAVLPLLLLMKRGKQVGSGGPRQHVAMD